MYCVKISPYFLKADVISISATVCQPIEYQSPKVSYLDSSCEYINWEPLSFASGYQDCLLSDSEYMVQLSETYDFASTVFASDWIPGQSYTVQNLNANTDYYFRIKARSASELDVHSGWSDIYSCSRSEQLGEGIKKSRGSTFGYRKLKKIISNLFNIHPAKSQIDPVIRPLIFSNGCNVIKNDEVENLLYVNDIELVHKFQSIGSVDNYPDMNFAPNRLINRAEAAKIIVKSLCNDLKIPPDYKITFSDLMRYSWYYDYVAKMAYNGYVIGYKDSEFKPAKSLTYAEALKMLVVSLVLNAADSLQLEGNYTHKFVHKSDWYYAFVNFAFYYDLISSDIVDFNPNDPITRIEFLKLFASISNIDSYEH
jgi:hypothetical protein